MSPLLFNVIDGTTGSILLTVGAIMVGAIVLEDTTAVIVGLLAADGIIPVAVALSALYAGVVIGDIILYSIGYLASTRPRLARYVDHGVVLPFRAWLESRFILTVFSARFIPGSRLPTYAATGFFRSSFSTFILTAVVATSIWTTFLFGVSYWFSSFTSTWLKEARWGIAFAFIITLFLLARRNLLAYRAQQKASGTDADIIS